MTQYTKGEWTIGGANYDHNCGSHYTIRESGAYPSEETWRANARLIAAAPKLLEACKAQHEAIDILFSMLIERSPNGHIFLPSKSGQPWNACLMGNAAIAAAKGEQP